MGRILSRTAQVNKSQSLIKCATERQWNVYRVMSALEVFVSDGVLRGRAYENAKGFIANIYLPICKALCVALEDEILADQKVIDACNTYLQGTDFIDEDAIRYEIKCLQRGIYELKDDWWESLPFVKKVNSLRIEYKLSQIKELEGYLEELESFDTATQGLHNYANIQMSFIKQKIDYIFTPELYVNGVYNYSGIDMSWAKESTRRWEENRANIQNRIKMYDVSMRQKYNSLLEQVTDGFDSAPTVLEMIGYLNQQMPLYWLFCRATREGWFNKLFDLCSFERSEDDGCFHVNVDKYQSPLISQLAKDNDGVCWQQFGGYCDTYDFVFDVFCDMDADQIEFGNESNKYKIWYWKGEYLNLGAGGELGLYEGDGQVVDCAVNDELKMSVHVDYGDGTSTDWSDETWWITTFNPEKQDVRAEDITMVYTLDFSSVDRTLWDDFVYECEVNMHENVTLDKDNMKADIVF